MKKYYDQAYKHVEVEESGGCFAEPFAAWGWLLVRFGVIYPDKIKEISHLIEKSGDKMLPGDFEKIAAAEDLAATIREIMRRTVL